MFASLSVPVFTLLPTAGASANADYLLNSNNPIVVNTGAPIPSGQGCTGSDLQYLDDNLTWNRTWRDASGISRVGIDNFYATNQIGIAVRPFQTWQQPLIPLLSGRLVRLSLTCQNGISGCVKFFVNSGLTVQRTEPCNPPNTTDWVRLLKKHYHFHSSFFNESHLLVPIFRARSIIRLMMMNFHRMILITLIGCIICPAVSSVSNGLNCPCSN